MSSIIFPNPTPAANSAAQAAAESETNASNAATAAQEAADAAEAHKNAAEAIAVATNSVAARFEPQPTDYVADIDLADETGLFRVANTQTANAPASPLGGNYDASLWVESVGGQIKQTLTIGDGVALQRLSESGATSGWGIWRSLDTWRLNPGKWQKHLITADLQPRPEAVSAGEAARFQSVLDSIAARHPDLTHAHVLGDLVYEGSQDTTGAAPEYGFPEFLADWRSRLPVPLENSYFMPGNHDRDGGDAGSHRKAWSMQSYRSWIGPEYYYTLQGNVMFVYMGDMGGSKAGAITDAVVAWFGALVRRHKDKNIFVCLHQPLSGTYLGKTEANDADAVQAGSARITAILDDVAADADNICAVFFGHVGSASQFNDETWHGTRHFQIGMHIPSNVTNARNDQYYTMEMRHGATSVGLVQWDATADSELATKNISLAYPLDLAPKVTRHMDGPRTEPVRVAVPLDEHADGSGNIPEGTKIPLGDFRFEDRANTANPNHLEAGLRFGWGVQNTGGDHDGTAASPAHEDAGWISLARLGGAGSGTAPTLAWVFRAMKDGVLTEAFRADADGLYLPGGVGLLTGAGSPEGAVSAPVGSMYTRTDGGAGSTLYVKESGTGNTGWAAK